VSRLRKPEDGKSCESHLSTHLKQNRNRPITFQSRVYGHSLTSWGTLTVNTDTKTKTANQKDYCRQKHGLKLWSFWPLFEGYILTEMSDENRSIWFHYGTRNPRFSSYTKFWVSFYPKDFHSADPRRTLHVLCSERYIGEFHIG